MLRLVSRSLRLEVRGSGRRAKLPRCVAARILELYGDEMGDASKVGFVNVDV